MYLEIQSSKYLKNQPDRSHNLLVSRVARYLCILFLSSLCVVQSVSIAAIESNLKIAVATNFLPVARQLVHEFESASEIAVQLSSASTGKLFTQIVQGRPLDILLAADQQHIQWLLDADLAEPENRHTYAIGHLALVLIDSHMPIRQTKFGYAFEEPLATLALAQPKVAPYGKAAQQTIENCLEFPRGSPKFVYGENIGQTYSFLVTGNAQVGLIAASMIKHELKSGKVLWAFPIEPDCHDPIVQDLVILSRTNSMTQARQFVDFVLSEPSQLTIRESGYKTP